jgi:hypothetical protein
MSNIRPPKEVGCPAACETDGRKADRAVIATCLAATLRARLNEEADAEARAQAMVQEDGGEMPEPPAAREYRLVPGANRRRRRPCITCGGKVTLFFGQLEVEGCIVSGSCEKTWTKLYPKEYRDETGKPIAEALPCGGYDCSAVFRLADEDGRALERPSHEDGVCTVDRNGEMFRTGEHRRLLNDMPLTNPDSGIEVFDGQQ